MFKHSDIQYISLTPDKILNSLVYRTLFYANTYGSFKLSKKQSVCFGPPCIWMRRMVVVLFVLQYFHYDTCKKLQRFDWNGQRYVQNISVGLFLEGSIRAVCRVCQNTLQLRSSLVFTPRNIEHALQNTQKDYHQWLSDSSRVHQIRFRPGLCPGPAGGPSCWFKRTYFKGRGGREREGKRQARGERREGEGGREGEGRKRM